MKKIMFSDRYGLTESVLEGRKTMTRRVCKEYKTGKIIFGDMVVSWRYYPDEGLAEFVMMDGSIMVAKQPYREGEEVAVAQTYKNALHPLDWVNREIYEKSKGWTNKMFVKAELMPNRIVMTRMNIERITSISEEDCFREGITKANYPGLYKFKNAGGLWYSPQIAFNHLFVEASMNKREALEALKRNAVTWAYEFGIKTGE